MVGSCWRVFWGYSLILVTWTPLRLYWNFPFMILMIMMTSWGTFKSQGGVGGRCQTFDRDARPIFWVWNLAKSYLSGLSNFLAIFLGFAKFRYFLGLTNFQLFFGSSNFCITHLNPLNEEHTVLKNKIIVASHIYSNFEHHCILSHSIFLGLNFRVILFFWVVEICSRTSIPVKEMLVYSPPLPRASNPNTRLAWKKRYWIGNYFIVVRKRC